VIAGAPALLSGAGILTAPAMPKEFYYGRHLHDQLGTGVVGEILRRKFGTRVLQDRDSRIPAALEGYALGAVLYQMCGETFCDDERCRLHDAHTQEGLIRAQFATGILCERHEEMVARLRRPARGRERPDSWASP